MASGGKPWWADDPELAAIRRRVDEELERARREPITSTSRIPLSRISGAARRPAGAGRSPRPSRARPRPSRRRGARGSRGGALMGRIRQSSRGFGNKTAASPLRPTCWARTPLGQHGFHQHHVVGGPQREVVVQLLARRPGMQERRVDAAGDLRRRHEQLLGTPRSLRRGRRPATMSLAPLLYSTRYCRR